MRRVMCDPELFVRLQYALLTLAPATLDAQQSTSLARIVEGPSSFGRSQSFRAKPRINIPSRPRIQDSTNVGNKAGL